MSGSHMFKGIGLDLMCFSSSIDIPIMISKYYGIVIGKKAMAHSVTFQGGFPGGRWELRLFLGDFHLYVENNHVFRGD
jgi:hypothetical protein